MRARSLIAILLFIPLFLGSCGRSVTPGQGAEQGTLTVRMVFPASVAASSRNPQIISLAAPDLSGLINTVRVTALGQSGNVSDSFMYSARTGVLYGIPAGGQYRVVVEAVKGGETVFCAVKSGLHVRGGQNTDVGELFMVRRKAGNVVYAPWGDWLGSDELRSTSVSVGDLDGDGDLDLVLGDDGGYSGMPNSVLINKLNESARIFSDTGQGYGTDMWVGEALGDVNGDGSLDIVAAAPSLGRVWANDGAGRFTSLAALGSPYTLSCGALADLDGDGNLDGVVGSAPGFAGTSQTAPSLFAMANSGGQLVAAAGFGSGFVRDIVLGDLDGDGYPDLVTAEFGYSHGGTVVGGANRVYFNDGAGEFFDSGQALGDMVTSSVALADADGDGDLDIVFGNEADASGRGRVSNTVHRNNGSGYFATGIPLGDSDVTLSAAAGDLDGDGDMDLVFGNDGPDSVYINDGAGAFDRAAFTLGQGRTRDVALGDLDGDGELDIACAGDGPDGFWLSRSTDSSTAGRLFFAANDGVRGTELWSYDAAAGAVTLVSDIGPGSVTSLNHLMKIVPFSNKLYFPANDGLNGCELWAYDGKRAYLAADLYPGRVSTLNSAPNSSAPQFFGATEDRFYMWSQYIYDPPGVNYKNWEYDEGGPAAIAPNVMQGPSQHATLSEKMMVRYNGRKYFAGYDAAYGRELWVRGAAAADMVTDIYSGTAGSDPQQLTVFRGQLFFSANDGVSGRELWVYDDAGGARLALDLEPAPNVGSNPVELTEYDGKLYFSANANLYEYEGEGDYPKFIQNFGGELEVFGGRLYIAQPWGMDCYDGTNLYSSCVDVGVPDGDYPSNLVVFAGRLFFVADDGSTGRELWAWDGTAAARIANIDGGVGDSIKAGPVLYLPMTPNETMSFAKSLQAIGGSATRSLILGDVDGDADLDAVEGNYNKPTRVWVNDGHGGFSTGASLDLRATNSVLMGDFTGDGKPDIVQGNFGQANLMWAGDGAGNFVSVSRFGGSSYTTALAVGDIDEDGDTDLVEANSTGNLDSDLVWKNNGFGTFTATGQSFGSGDTGTLLLHDLDGDYDLDLFVGTRQFTYNYFLDNNKNGFFQGTTWIDQSNCRGAAAGDVDRDGDLDLVVGDSTGTGIRVFLNNGSGEFTDSGQVLGADDSLGLALGDLDRDGDLDLVAANWNDLARVYLNDGDGGFTDSRIVFESGPATSVALGDADRDADLDVFLGYETGPNAIWLNGLR